MRTAHQCTAQGFARFDRWQLVQSPAAGILFSGPAFPSDHPLSALGLVRRIDAPNRAGRFIQNNHLRPEFFGCCQQAAALRLVYVPVRAILFTGLAVQRSYYLTHFFAPFSERPTKPHKYRLCGCVVRCGAGIYVTPIRKRFLYYYEKSHHAAPHTFLYPKTNQRFAASRPLPAGLLLLTSAYAAISAVKFVMLSA